MNSIAGFHPDFLGGYPGVLRALAVLKRRGMGEGVQPRVMASSGAVLDGYTRGYIEKAFDCRVFDVYGSTEAGPVAFECQEGRYHVHTDFVVVEPTSRPMRTRIGPSSLLARGSLRECLRSSVSPVLQTRSGNS